MTHHEKVIKTINGLEALDRAMHENQCYACSHEFVDAAKTFGTDILQDAIAVIIKQSEIIEQYHKVDALLTVHGWKWRSKSPTDVQDDL